MTTTYQPTHGAYPGAAFDSMRAPVARTATRYAGAAALCAAIRAAAELAPEVAPAAEFPERYASGFYPQKSTLEFEAGARLWMNSYRIINRQRIGESEEVTTCGPASAWPREYVRAETMGPFLPAPTDARVSFAYSTPDGARGSLTVANLRAALLTLADKVHKARAVYDGKTRRAARPAKPAGSAPHVAARALWEAGQPAEALQLAEGRGALYFGNASKPGEAVPYMSAEPLELAGHGFTVARAIRSGRFRVMHTASGFAVDSVTAGAPQSDGFKTGAAALEWIESRMACDDFRAKLAAAVQRAAAFDQRAARALYLTDDGAETCETGAPVAAEPAADTVAAQPVPDAAAAADATAPRGESPALAATCGAHYAWMSEAARRVYWVHCQTAKHSRAVDPEFSGMLRRPRSVGLIPDYLAPAVRAHRALTAAAVRAERDAARGAALLARMYPNGVPANVRYATRAEFEAISAARPLPTVSPAAPLPTVCATGEAGRRESERFEAAAVRADAIGNARRAEVLRELAAEESAPPATQPAADALRAEIASMHPGDVYDLIADNGYETDATRFQSIEGQRAAVECIAREVGALAFRGMLARLSGDEHAMPREALQARARASVAAPTPCLRIPGYDLRRRVPPRFAPGYVLRAGGAS